MEKYICRERRDIFQSLYLPSRSMGEASWQTEV